MLVVIGKRPELWKEKEKKKGEENALRIRKGEKEREGRKEGRREEKEGRKKEMF